jgi:hypothetical protein
MSETAAYDEVVERLLGVIPKHQKESRNDYSIMSVGVMTLALILFVEIFRHRMSEHAKGKPLFSAVLENVYRECE